MHLIPFSTPNTLRIEQRDHHPGLDIDGCTHGTVPNSAKRVGIRIDFKTIAHGRLSMFATGFSQDPESHCITFNMSKVKFRNPWNLKNQENLISYGKKKSRHTHDEMTHIFELFGKDLKETINFTKLQKTI